MAVSMDTAVTMKHLASHLVFGERKEFKLSTFAGGVELEPAVAARLGGIVPTFLKLSRRV